MPGQTGASAGAASAPGASSTGLGDAFAYPADGSIARTGALSSSVSAATDAGAASYAVTDVLGVSLLNGEITIDSVAGRARAPSFTADTGGSTPSNVIALGQPVGVAPYQRVALGDWGTLVLLEGVAEHDGGATIAARASVTAVRVTPGRIRDSDPCTSSSTRSRCCRWATTASSTRTSTCWPGGGWKRLFRRRRGWAPPVPAWATAPRPGAFLLGSTDISIASGLEPGSLERALVAPVSAEGDGALLRSG